MKSSKSRRKSKKAQRYSELARCRWSGRDRDSRSTTDDNSTESHILTGENCETADNYVLTGDDNCETADSHVITGENCETAYNHAVTSFDNCQTAESHIVTGENCETADKHIAEVSDNCESLIDLCLFGDQATSLIEPVVQLSAEMEVGEEIDDTENRSGDSNAVIDDSNSSDSEGESSEYLPTPVKKLCLSEDVSPIELGNSLFLCQKTQL